MADPILPGVYRAMWVMQHPSGLPEDRFVNTWYFRETNITGSDQTVHDQISNVLEAFYMNAAANGSRVIGFIPSSHVASAQLRTYHLGEEPPRTPIISNFDTTGLTASGASYPTEVAACLSYRTTRKGPRGRGRIFLGPLVATVGVDEAGWRRPSTIFRTTVVDRANDVLGTTENVVWVGVSGMDLEKYDVTGGYVDDTFDTVRKRGASVSTRTTFGDYVLAA